MTDVHPLLRERVERLAELAARLEALAAEACRCEGPVERAVEACEQLEQTRRSLSVVLDQVRSQLGAVNAGGAVSDAAVAHALRRAQESLRAACRSFESLSLLVLQARDEVGRRLDAVRYGARMFRGYRRTLGRA